LAGCPGRTGVAGPRGPQGPQGIAGTPGHGLPPELFEAPDLCHVINASNPALVVGQIALVVLHHATNEPPTGTLRADGALVAVSAYPDLFAVVGTRFGGDGVSTFRLPAVSVSPPPPTTPP